MKTNFLQFLLLFLLIFGISPIINAQNISLNLASMTPHIGEALNLKLINKNTLKEEDRTQVASINSASFTVNLSGQIGESYYIDFYADHNANGIYDALPVDHAWRIEANALVAGTNDVDFTHNTNFADIEWKQMLTFNFEGMTPHVGQKLQVAIKEKNRVGKEVGRVVLGAIPSANFSLDLPFLEIGKSYTLDFFADHNGNDVYDAPPMDHAWTMSLNNVTGDESLTFTHNTNFTDIEWKQMLTFNFEGMTPHVGQKLTMRVKDVNQINREVGRLVVDAILMANFSVELPFLEIGRTYIVDFYADHNGNGLYDAPPMDHAWSQMVVANGDEEKTFTHNTNFQDIGENSILTVDFSNMTPHVGELLELRILDVAAGKEVERTKFNIEMPNFSVSLPGIVTGKEYQVDFYADHNGNGLYDAPPVDHAWRENFTSIDGDLILMFNHNTNFVDIDWDYMMTLNAQNMTPHLGEKFELKVKDLEEGQVIGDFTISDIQVPSFFVRVPGIKLGKNYDVDFYADHNGNLTYDAPPIDHAWRINFDDTEGDELVLFEHNTNFVDIMFLTGNEELTNINNINIFPNPVIDGLSLKINLKEAMPLNISLYNMLGERMKGLYNNEMNDGEYILHFYETASLENGMYFIQIQDENGAMLTKRFVKN